jgi:anti-anti-sigma factor
LDVALKAFRGLVRVRKNLPAVSIPMLKPSVEVRAENGILVAEFWDCLRLDPAPVQDLRARFDEHVRGGGRADLVVDLNGVGFAGSAALGGFVGIHKQARKQSGRVVFCNVDPTVREVLRVSKLDTLLPVAVDKAAALAVIEGEGKGDLTGEANPLQPPKPSGSNPSPLGRRRKPK